MRYIKTLIITCVLQSFGFAQTNSVLLLGYDNVLFDTNVTSTKARLLYDSSSYQLVSETRKMPFYGAQATISDSIGNLLIASNGCWIADASNDTMLNGGGLNPDPPNDDFTNDWCTITSGIPYPASNLLLPKGLSHTDFTLFHQTGSILSTVPSHFIYKTDIDLTLNSGLGGVTSKNVPILKGNINSGMTACRHANGRDWWVIAFKDSLGWAYRMLYTEFGITQIDSFSLSANSHSHYIGTPVFSPDGTKFAYYYYSGPWGNVTNQIRVFEFDRCNGNFSNEQIVTSVDSTPGVGLMFSSSSQYLYWSVFNTIFQLDINAPNLSASQQIVAVNDGYYSPYWPYQSDFWLMTRPADGKIYITSGSSVIDLHYIEYPDSAGTACNVMQHALHLPCFNNRIHSNFVNYQLGPVIGSVCDSLGVGLAELNHVRLLKIYPNPVKSGGILTIHYELPQNKSGEFIILDAIGKQVYRYPLPTWSSMQELNLPLLQAGLYFGKVLSGSSQLTMKIIIK